MFVYFNLKNTRVQYKNLKIRNKIKMMHIYMI